MLITTVFPHFVHCQTHEGRVHKWLLNERINDLRKPLTDRDFFHYSSLYTKHLAQYPTYSRCLINACGMSPSVTESITQSTIGDLGIQNLQVFFLEFWVCCIHWLYQEYAASFQWKMGCFSEGRPKHQVLLETGKEEEWFSSQPPLRHVLGFLWERSVLWEMQNVLTRY